ncbi:MAG TPA: hypothetical protein VHX17_00620, partial [Candidatus Cybelea sp.]|jgi:hypothetical protein|nr:hypothetical protein [Candidatus Cybelea sp.]
MRPALVATLILFSLSGCSSGPIAVGPSQTNAPSGRAYHRRPPGDGLGGPALIAIDQLSGDLIYWSIKDGPSSTPVVLTGYLGTFDSNALVADGDVVIVASLKPAEIIKYNVRSKTETTVADPFGPPFHVAVDKSGAVYAVSRHKIGVFPKNSAQPYEIGCRALQAHQLVSVAIDDENDVFVAAGYRHGTEIVELPAGSPSGCVKLGVRPPSNFGGIGIDPKTDDLIVVDNPGLLCEYEGRLTIYPKPYAKATAETHDFNANICAGGFRLDANSKHIYISDETIDESYPLIDVRSYPSASGNASYVDYAGYTGGFTLLPSTLPN